ncbi:MAG: hypothetical protein U1E51_09095 [Candidatus Binatia bacterium]|nr:hypothetical protein [Candidatus Binatia bacterium]
MDNDAETIIVMPSPHGEYKSGISYSDALAAGEVYASLRKRGHLDVRTPELLGDDTRENLILIGGRKANPIARDFQRLEYSKLSFDLRDGVIYDKQKHIVLVPQYAAGQERTLANLVADYGLISTTDNPFGKSTKILQLAGIRGFGTLAAAIALVDPRPVRTIEKILTRLIRRHALQPKNLTVEILVRVSVSRGRARRDSLAIEKIKVSNGRTSRTWESEAYGQLKPVSPHGLYIDVVRSASKAPIIRARIDNEEITFTKSSDRMKTIYLLAKQAIEDDLNRSGNQGWMNAVQLAESLWQIKLTSGGSELIGELRTEVSEAIRRWANHLERQGKLLLPDNVTVDHQYINSEILIFDSDIKKKVVDLIHMINHEQSKNNTGFQLIESKPGLGYRINIHPALIFINESNSPATDPQ